MQTFTLPWGAWHGDVQRTFQVPDDWQLEVFTMDTDVVVSDEVVRQALERLRADMAVQKPGSAIIVVDDLTRPVDLSGLLPRMLDHMNAAGVTDDRIRVLIGLGSHAPLSEEDLQKKLGRVTLQRVACINHSPEETEPIGMEWGKTPIRLNRHYLAAEYKVVISGLTPHSFAGFSGGAKMLVPGIADMETLTRTHKSVLMGFMGKLGSVEKNKFRDTIESFVEKAGLDYFFGLVINADRSIRALYDGHYVEAHRAASEYAAGFYRQPVNGPYDVVITSAYPKDTELLQAENALIPIKSGKENLLKEGGTLIVMSACSQGPGHHGLFGVNGRLYRVPRPLRILKPYQTAFFFENITVEDFGHVFNSAYYFSADWEALLNHVRPHISNAPRVAIFPYGSMQLTG
ncbi:MAG: DUF2088 domain-containing protein [Calditrichaeota bacterium]|nr:MAG: DUF2088 domain-containing protein [Calditrichota bacterium]